MDWTLFWTAFGAVGGTFGAVATAVAVIIALWQTRYSNKKKLKVVFSDGIKIMSCLNDKQVVKEYVGITVTNIGNRRVKLCDWRLFLSKGNGFIILQDEFAVNTKITTKWPVLLEIEEQTDQVWDKESFYKCIKEYGKKLPQNQRKKRILFVVKDSTGKFYKVKSTKTINEYISEAEKVLL